MDDAIILSSGLAWLYHIGSGGQLRAVALRYAGEAIFPSELSMGFGVQTLTSSRVARCSGAAFRQLFARSEHLLSEMISRQHRIALAWLMRSTLDTHGRLAHLFCELAARGGQTADLNHTFRLPFTQTELSSLTGQTTVNVNRVMRDWARSGFVAQAPKLLSVDWPRFVALAGLTRPICGTHECPEIHAGHSQRCVTVCSVLHPKTPDQGSWIAEMSAARV